MFTAIDHLYMAHALRLAERGLCTTTPNPRVGCVIVRDGQLMGCGWHEAAGEPHAEIHALSHAGIAARGGTAYITLEPCSHYGRTPPCTNALIEAGIAKVIIAMEDPNPIVSGQGVALLQQAGILVQQGLMREEAYVLNIGFISRMVGKKPWLRLKIAASLDGKTALNNGSSQWITGEPARVDGHRWRARSCAILTGSGTVLADNPQLTVRHIKAVRQPKKIVVDRDLSIPLDAKLLQGEERPWIFTANTGHLKKKDMLLGMGANVIELPDSGGAVDLKAMMVMLADFGINEILVESGYGLNGALVAAGLADEAIIYLAPQFLGRARGMLNLPELKQLDQKVALKIQDLCMIGSDIRVIARFD
ncbi:MAG: bifunctional diaminohydroxyphosphoribosylaminopyrimidine deaminase/5-amino-6-(5-phosphoribosylamino)uracil reductase RibD [Nitrosomonas sp.]|nr:MAG: bifunctional diaminohydroxyphosphoribosylaminopyrimidine deaminase/5-amino-6-(5-phosphoribosylamino)uracil reductase RibD [Nitrosomonas sp.]